MELTCIEEIGGGGKMKIKLGNTVSCSLFPKQYEKFEASASLEIEVDVEEKDLEAKLEEISLFIMEKLTKEIEIKSAEYLVRTEKVKNKIKTALKNM